MYPIILTQIVKTLVPLVPALVPAVTASTTAAEAGAALLGGLATLNPATFAILAAAGVLTYLISRSGEAHEFRVGPDGMEVIFK